MFLVLGGSGYVGRRVCKELVQASSSNEKSRIVSISRNGKPPSWCFDIDDDDHSWSERVEWIQRDISSESLAEDGDSLVEALGDICKSIINEDDENLPVSPLETTIVGCIGNVNPDPSWLGLWGLGFDNDRLLEENGKVYEFFLEEIESLRKKNLLKIERCVLQSIDYTCQKCLEGPIDGYVDGKRLAERTFLEVVSDTHGGGTSDPSNLEKVVVIGMPNFVFGGKRFPGFGKFYRKFVESPFAKAYVGGNNALRSLSVADPEDWVEATLFSPPFVVYWAVKPTAMAARGLVTRNIVNDGQPRKQGFFNTTGKPVEYDDILFVDGTHEIEKLVGVLSEGDSKGIPPRNKVRAKQAESSSTPEPLWEGALIGKRPYLYPFPAAIFFSYVFWGVVTQQFVQTVPTV
jgi:hypothetical protein